MKDEKIYKKYSHIIKGSIELVTRGTIIKCGKNYELTSHGKICVINCINEEKSHQCMKTRIINIQDAGQVTLCRNCIRLKRNIQRRRKKT
ncbi:hypothetical protein LCGC14_1328900 [marine sediment metagenome]|uniref:Uncharacterized protein n=1 Tax=marine sediment metagenome TaxID=412755 RepID=A0A0F9KH64_9ZZZZ